MGVKAAGRAELAHIDGPAAPPLLGHTPAVLKDSYGFHKAAIARYGPTYKLNVLGAWRVTINGPDILEFALNDPERMFSSAKGWDALEKMFPNGLLARDFEDHRAHRRIMQVAFKAAAMSAYEARVRRELDTLIARWPVGEPFAFYPAVKMMSLSLGAAVFMGLPVDHPDAKALNAALIDEVNAVASLVRTPLPFTRMRRGVMARRKMIAWLNEKIEERRTAGGGEDFFSQMCVAMDEDGTRWTAEEIVDHFNGLLMAAHDTTASAITAMVALLADHPEWQERIAEEAVARDPEAPSASGLALTETVAKEALRLVPPVPFLPRFALRPFAWDGLEIPAGTRINVSPGMVLLSPKLYADPERFDPTRFGPERAEDRAHRFAFAPFGGGAHKCIGMHFALMEMKLFAASLFSRHRVAHAGAGPVSWQRMPIPRPRGGLPIVLTPRGDWLH